MTSVACPHCGSVRVTREGPRSRTVETLAAGRVVDRPATVVRVSCREPDCGRMGSVYDPADAESRRLVREHVARRVFSVGQTAAALECGIERNVVQRILAEWSAIREADVHEAAPEFLVVEPVHLRKADRLLAIDADRSTLVEIAFGYDELRAWVAGRVRPPEIACLPVDPLLHALFRETVPGCERIVAPVAMRRAILSAALGALGSLRRAGGYRGSNGMPDEVEFGRALVDGPKESWPLAASAILCAARAALAVLDAGSRAGGERLWTEMRLASDVEGGQRISATLETWREPVLAGLDHGFLDRLAALADGARSAMVLRRPVLGLEDLRRLVLLRDFERRSMALVRPDMPPVFAVWGRDLASIALDLAA